MNPKGHFTQVDIGEMKALVYRKIGPERATVYFDILNRYFNSQIQKPDFNRLCLKILRKENISLHNRLIQSILTNASLPQVPPPKSTKPNNIPRVPRADEFLSTKLLHRHQTKRRSRFNRENKFRPKRPSPLGPLGKSTSSAVDGSQTEFNSCGSRLNVVPVEDGEEVEQVRRSSIKAPIGVSVNLNGGEKILLSGSNSTDFYSMTCQSSGVLPDAKSLKRRIDQMFPEGVRVSEDSVNLLNKGLNMYLKRVIKPGMALARSRSGFGFWKNLSVLDFCASMESNPYVLGEDWGVQLERIGFRAYGI